MPIRWALMFTVQKDDRAPAIRLIEESRVDVWRACGWYLLSADTDVIFAGIEDVRQDDERGRR